MKEVLVSTAVAGGTGFIGWFISKLTTRRERRRDDLQLINDAISPLIESIKSLTDHNNNLVQQLLDEQKKNLELIQEKALLQQEKGELMEKVERLEKEVKALTRKINEFVRDK